MRSILLTILIPILGFSSSLEELRNFFLREGYIVETDKGSVVTDLGQDKTFVGEQFIVLKEGSKIVHPVTGRILGRKEEIKGLIEITDLKKNFSFARVLEDKGIKKGYKIKLKIGSICFEGSEESFFLISSVLKNVIKGKKWDSTVKELKEGYGITFKNKPIAFFPYSLPSKGKVFKIKAQLIKSFNGLPLSADLCKFGGKRYIAVLFEEFLVVYRFEEKLSEYTKMYLPAGFPLWIQCVQLEDSEDFILISMITGDSANSLIVKLENKTPFILEKDIPLLIAVLDKRNPQNTFVGQEFDSRNLWGEIKRLKFKSGRLILKEKYPAPPGFRVDSAYMYKDFLIFIDSNGYLKVFKGSELVLSRKKFGGSYTTAELPDIYEMEENYSFNPRVSIIFLQNKAYALFIKNSGSPAHNLLNLSEFQEGEVYLLKLEIGSEIQKAEGKSFKKAIQSIVPISETEILVLTAKKGTLSLNNRGSLYKVKILLQ